jgi:RHS repeat-associated protein
LPKTITKDASNSSTFEYGPDGQRWRHVYRTAGANYTHTYIGRLLEKVVGPTSTDWKHYIYANGEPVAMYIRKSIGNKNRYSFTKDRLGSVVAIVHSDGMSILRESFDAFGQRRGSSTWTGSPTSTELTNMNGQTRRGFTMHEHLDSTGLVHMNGRVFDPFIGRFASADPFLQNPFNLQLLNRYSYAGNNPLRFTDPSGFLFTEPCGDCSITFPPDYDWPDLDLCFFNCPPIPTGPPQNPVTCVYLRGHKFCGDLFNRGRRPPPPPPPLVQGEPAPDADPVPLPQVVTLAAENVATLPWFWQRPNTRQQVSSQKTNKTYTLVRAPEGYGIDVDIKEAQRRRARSGPGGVIADVRYVPESQNPDLPKEMYVEVTTGELLGSDDDFDSTDNGPEGEPQSPEAAEVARQIQELKRHIQQYEDAARRGESGGSPIPESYWEAQSKLLELLLRQGEQQQQ